MKKVVRLVRKFKNVLVGVAAALALAAPVVIMAAPSSTQLTYQTAMQETTPMSLPGYYAGTLKLTVASDGAVQGWYLPDNTAPAITVSGWDEKGKFRLSLGNGNFHINAVKQRNGKLVGSAERILPPTSTFPRTFSFVATPTSD